MTQINKALTLSAALTLGACSMVETPSPPTAGQQQQATAPLYAREELVVENLVTEAGRLGNMDIGGVGKILTGEPAEDGDSRVEPVTPTIPMSANRIVEQAINDLLQNRRHVIRLWLDRGITYFPMIEKIFEEENVPDELKYIALGESGLQPTARSYVGAAGMWQFMPGTGRGAGLTINDWVDERLDPEKATRAAARHLKVLYDAYGGNWHLALAGYNCSYRCISRAVRRAGGSIENPPSFWAIYPYLPDETKAFVPKYIAAALVVSNPAMYGIDYEPVGQELAYDVVEIEGMMRLEDAAELAGTDEATLRLLNPSLRKSSLPDTGEPFPLKIPLGSFDRFVSAFEELPEEEKSAPTEYTISRGDTLGSIAARFGVPTSELQAFNGISGHLIHPGQKLQIPGTGVSTALAVTSSHAISVRYGEPRYRPIKLREEFQLVEQSASEDGSPIMAVSLQPQVENDDFLVPTVYKVRQGDTLSAISSRFHVSVSEIQQWNGLAGSMIRVGEELTIHTPASAPETTVYQVRPGDNLGAIARRFGVSVDDLKSLNGLNSNLIYPGQQLVLNDSDGDTGLATEEN